MMYGTASSGPWIWLHIHWLFWGIALFGFIAGLLWLYKHAGKKDFLKIVWLTLAIGIFGGLLTASVALTSWNQMMEAHHSSWGDDERFDMEDFMEDMMDWDEENHA